MAPPQQPLRLFDISLTECVKQIDRTCIEVAKKHRYEFSTSELDLLHVNWFLRDNIPARLIDRIYDTWSNSDISCDPRFGTTILVHTHMKRLTLIPNENPSEFYRSVSFWRAQLCRAENLVELNFSSLCTDEMLEVVGKFCISLRYLNAESSVTKYTDQLGHPVFKLNVSDEGLAHIANCKNLRVIEIDDWHNPAMLDASVTINGVSMLLNSLPEVKHITCRRIGELLSTGMIVVNKLKLEHAHDNEPSEIHMKNIIKFCPDLRSIHLYFRIDNGPNENDMTDVFNEIINSNLSLKQLTLENCITNNAFTKCLRVKGNLLNELKIDIFNAMSSKLIHFIGIHCPNLKVLWINELTGRTQPLNIDKTDKELFPYLKALKLTGESWNPRQILPEILSNCFYLNYLHVECKTYDLSDATDKVFNDIIAKNPLKSLVFFHAACYLKFCTLQYFASLPNMKDLFFVKKIGFISENDIEVLFGDMHDFNINFEYFDRDLNF